MKLPAYTQELVKLSGLDDTTFLESILERKEMRKGEFLFQEGDICRHVFFIEKGIVRLFYYSNSGKDITAWFFAENSTITAIDSFYYHKATHDYCELLEDSVIYTIKYSDLEKLLAQEKSSRLVFHVLYELMRKITDFMTSMKFQSAQERYNTMLKDHPHIFQRASLGHIASFLGITQETLSRIRAGK